MSRPWLWVLGLGLALVPVVLAMGLADPQGQLPAGESDRRARDSGGATIAAKRHVQENENDRNLSAFLASPILWIAVAAALLLVGAWAYIKLSATTDPLELAETDPWIQARLAQSRANAQDADPLGARAQDEPPG